MRKFVRPSLTQALIFWIHALASGGACVMFFGGISYVMWGLV